MHSPIEREDIGTVRVLRPRLEVDAIAEAVVDVQLRVRVIVDEFRQLVEQNETRVRRDASPEPVEQSVDRRASYLLEKFLTGLEFPDGVVTVNITVVGTFCKVDVGRGLRIYVAPGRVVGHRVDTLLLVLSQHDLVKVVRTIGAEGIEETVDG